MANRLAHSTSPYLLAHADNPVDWYEWGQEAFDEAKRRDIPIFLSVGYSACHWCHVMAHESFEDENTAVIMNELFVNIKVDREELPEIDGLYMEATQAMTGRGGWPMSVWLDHDRKPWYAGTYFPNREGSGSPTFIQVLLALSNTWSEERDRVHDSTQRLVDVLNDRTIDMSAARDGFSLEVIKNSVVDAVETLAVSFDPIHGGFGADPKFPAPMVMEFLMRFNALNILHQNEEDPRAFLMVDRTMEAMARGGIYDQLNGGFARYAVDNSWTVPHFEKMLYDNAQLLLAYAHWFRFDGNDLSSRIVQETADFMINSMRAAEGGFISALDADSLDADGHSHEGAFYVWTRAEFDELLGDDALWAAELLGVTETGNFENGQSVLTLQRDPDDWGRWFRVKRLLQTAQSARSLPARDDKIITSWNALMIRGLAEAGAIFDRSDWLEAAAHAADYLVVKHLGIDPQHPGRVARVSRGGEVNLSAPGQLDDHAHLALALFTLAQTMGDDTWLDLGLLILEEIFASFVQGDSLCDSPIDAEDVMVGVTTKRVDPTDNVTPSGWTSTIEACLIATGLTGNPDYQRRVQPYIMALSPIVAMHTRFAGQAAAVFVGLLDGPREVAVVPGGGFSARSFLARATAPGMVYAWGDDQLLTTDRPVLDKSLTYYICQGFVCSAPTTDRDAVKAALGIRPF